MAQAFKESAISIQEGHIPIHPLGTAPMMEIFKVAAEPHKFGSKHDPRTESLQSGTLSSHVREKKSIIASFSDRDTQNSLHKYLPFSPKEQVVPTLALNHDKQPPVTDSRGFLNARNLNSPTSATGSLTSRAGLTRFGVLTEGTTKSSRIHFGVMSPQELYIPQGFNRELKDTEAWRRFNQTALYYDQLSRRLDDSLKSSEKTKPSRGVLGTSKLIETPKSDLKGLLERLQERNQQQPLTSAVGFGGSGATRRFLTPQKLEFQSKRETTQDERMTTDWQQEVKSPRVKARQMEDKKIQIPGDRGLGQSPSPRKLAKEGHFGKSRRKSKAKPSRDDCSIDSSDDIGVLRSTWTGGSVPTKDFVCRVPFTPKVQPMTPKWTQKFAGTKPNRPTRS